MSNWFTGGTSIVQGASPYASWVGNDPSAVMRVNIGVPSGATGQIPNPQASFVTLNPNAMLAARYARNLMANEYPEQSAGASSLFGSALSLLGGLLASDSDSVFGNLLGLGSSDPTGGGSWFTGW